MKRMFAVLLAILLVITGIACWYVYPQEKLDLNYSHFAVSDKIKEMIRSRSLEFHLSEEDINNLLKKGWANRSLGNGAWEMTGARFELRNDLLIAHVNLRYQKLIPIGTVSYFQLTWEKPNVKANPLYTQIRNWNIPKTWVSLPVQSVSLESMLPAILKVKNINFEQNTITIHLQLS